MRVAITLEQCWHRVPGGTAVAALEVLGPLQRQGVQLVGVAARHRRPPAEPWVPSVPVRHLLVPRPVLYEAWGWGDRPTVQSVSGPVEVVHATTLIVPPSGGAALVVTVHDLAFRHEPAHFTNRGLRAFERGLVRARRADAVLCSSHATYRDAIEAGFDPDRLHHVPLGVAVTEVPDVAVADARRRYGLDRPYVAFVGTVEPRKNLRRLADAVDRQPDPDLVLAVVGPAGWGDGAPPASAGRVRMLGFVPEADKQALLAGAEVCGYPSLREGFGLPVLEAMAVGTPVVTSRGTATEEAAGGAAVLVDPLDVESIASGLDEARRRSDELRAAGRSRAAACSWDTTAALTRRVYEEVTGR